MKKLALLTIFLALPLMGCGPIRVTVYGANGTQYTAPSLCAAQLACKKAGESACYYETMTVESSNGDKTIEACKVVKN